MKTNVRSYTDDQLLERVALVAEGFTEYPEGYWLIGVRSNEDEANKFDDKFYLFYKKQFVKVYSGTTHTGIKGLKGFAKYNPDGAAVLKADTIVYDSHRRGMSKGRGVYRQDKVFPYYRDNDMDDKAEEIGELYEDKIIYCHIHDCKLEEGDDPKEYINGWSLGCQVLNNPDHWHDFFNRRTKDQELITLCILNEFEV
jgi:hypothetical protein